MTINRKHVLKEVNLGQVVWENTIVPAHFRVYCDDSSPVVLEVNKDDQQLQMPLDDQQAQELINALQQLLSHPYEEEKNWGVWCVVSGGVTGHREAWLKTGGVGNVPEAIWSGTEAEATEESKRLMKVFNNSRSLASFSYTPRRF